MRLALPAFGQVARRTLPFLGALLTLTACLGSETTSVPNIPSNPAVETYNSATGVVIANMSKVNDNLFIQETAVGTGAEAVSGKVLDMRYTGRLTNGKVFDTNVGKTIFTFTLGSGQVISGWDLGLVGMKVGGKRKLVIGSTLAYANQSPDPSAIPQNSTLVFDVELIAVR
jgi:FKBP-type peptidyl-prolyl cis-trans isomerase